MTIQQILQDNQFRESKNKPGLWVRDYGDVVVFADLRKDANRPQFYGQMEGHPAPHGDIEDRIKPIKRAMMGLDKRQTKLNL